eukprot:661871-Hanusia_phi.AAC.3
MWIRQIKQINLTTQDEFQKLFLVLDGFLGDASTSKEREICRPAETDQMPATARRQHQSALRRATERRGYETWGARNEIEKDVASEVWEEFETRRATSKTDRVTHGILSHMGTANSTQSAGAQRQNMA